MERLRLRDTNLHLLPEVPDVHGLIFGPRHPGSLLPDVFSDDGSPSVGSSIFTFHGLSFFFNSEFF